MKTYGEWRYSSTFLDLGTRRRASGQLHAPAALPGGRAPGTHWMGGVQGLTGRCGEEKNLALPGIEPGPPNP
jgi:hypothetical protein